MKIVYNNILPFPGFAAMMFFGIILARKAYAPLRAAIIRHEEIHKAQAMECGGYLPYYCLYLWWCVFRGYRNNPLERCAYAKMNTVDYLERRQRFAWRWYVNLKNTESL